MIQKLYVLKNGNELAPVPGQLTNKINLEFSKDFKGDMPPENCQVLALVNLESEKILEILEVMDSDKFIDEPMLKKVAEENKQLKGVKSNLELEYPIPDDLYIDELTWRFVIAALELGTYPLVIGPKGCGKTQTAISAAKALKHNFYSVNCGAILKPKGFLVGTMHAKDGSTMLVPSEFLKHFTSEEPTIIFLDEIPRIIPGAANYFMTILDRLDQYVYVEEEGRKMFKGPNVKFMGAGNYGFEYTDTRNLDGAFNDRFIKFGIDYLERQQEIDLLLQKVPGVNPKYVEKLVDNANVCRKNIETVKVAVSTRQLIDMSMFIRKGFTLNQVMDRIFYNLFVNGTSNDRQTVEELLKATN